MTVFLCVMFLKLVCKFEIISKLKVTKNIKGIRKKYLHDILSLHCPLSFYETSYKTIRRIGDG